MPRWPALILALLMAGCAGDPPVDPPCTDCGDDPLLDGTRDLRTDLLANDTLAAPTWQVGDVFEQHMFFGSSDREGRHIKTMVVEAGSGGYLVATPDKDAAKFDAAYDYPILGRIGPSLETTAFTSDWSWMYRFPLTDGLTWNAEVEELYNWNQFRFYDHSIALMATYDAAIDTPHGDYPGFWIDGVTADGDTLARYNFVPAIGWFSHFWLYDVVTPEADDVMFHAMSMGVSKNYTGPYWLAEAQVVAEHFFGHFPNPDDPANSVQGDPAPQTFDVPASDAVMGVVVPIAAGGRTEIAFTLPGGQERTYEHQQLDLEGSGYRVIFPELPGDAGQWQARIVATAAFGGGYYWLASITIEEGALD